MVTNDVHLVWAEVDLGAIAGNVRELCRVVKPAARLMVAVKANAYGHGAVEVARTALAHGADWLGVARFEEAVALREAGIAAPILIFGYTPAGCTRELIRLHLTQSVYSLETARALSEQAAGSGGPKNPKALLAYYLGIASGLPFIGLPFGIAAFVLGIQGLRARKQNPVIKGSVHAGIGIGCGLLFTILWSLVLVGIVVGIASQ